jgi:hypothetical protein
MGRWPKRKITPLRKRGVTCLREAASAKAGGRFSEDYVFSTIDPFKDPFKYLDPPILF